MPLVSILVLLDFSVKLPSRPSCPTRPTKGEKKGDIQVFSPLTVASLREGLINEGILLWQMPENLWQMPRQFWKWSRHF
jgi:hypothetical protein